MKKLKELSKLSSSNINKESFNKNSKLYSITNQIKVFPSLLTETVQGKKDLTRTLKLRHKTKLLFQYNDKVSHQVPQLNLSKLCFSLKTKKYLNKLEVLNWKCSVSNINMLSLNVQGLKCLTTLLLEFHFKTIFHEKVMESLCRCFSKLKKLSNLHLNLYAWEKFGNKELKKLSIGIKHLKFLSMLYLIIDGRSRLSDGGDKQLFKCYKTFKIIIEIRTFTF